MSRLIEHLRNIFDDHLTRPCPAAFAGVGTAVPWPVSREEVIAFETETAAPCWP